MAKASKDLPEECWEEIFDRIGTPAEDHHLEPLSLVCKSFLASSSRVRSTLNISDRTLILSPSPDEGDISPLFRRFHRLKRISFVGFHGNLERVIDCLSRSDLRLEALDLSSQKEFPSNFRKLGLKMKGTMKILICAKIPNLADSHLVEMAVALPELEEVDISYPFSSKTKFSDLGVKKMSLELPKLRSINLSGSEFITDVSMRELSNNCPLLSSISARTCRFITGGVIQYVIRNCSNLSSLSIGGNAENSRSPDFSPANALRSLDLSRVHIENQSLFATKVAKLPLRKLVLSNCKGFTFPGIYILLLRCDSLQHLDLNGTDFLTDVMISHISNHLQRLISIGLNWCTRLTSLAFFHLVNDCPLLEEIRMENTSLGKNLELVSKIGKNRCSIRSLRLMYNTNLCDETLERIGIVCPELRLLDVSYCGWITGMGIGVIGRYCTEITKLGIVGCTQVTNLGLDIEFLKLDVLLASSSGIGYIKWLRMIGRGCPRLRVLDLSGCNRVTEKALKELVRSDGCRTSLRRLDLKNCNKVSTDFLAWMVFSCTSLRTIISPCNLPHTAKKKNVLLRQRCLVTSESPFSYKYI